jgi:hypothetical protein
MHRLGGVTIYLIQEQVLVTSFPHSKRTSTTSQAKLFDARLTENGVFLPFGPTTAVSTLTTTQPSFGFQRPLLSRFKV